MYPSERGYVQQIRAQMKEVQAIVEDVMNQLEDITPEILIAALTPTKELAEYYCPKDTGALVESSYLEVTDTGKKPRVELGFAKGGEPFYAVYVHEITEYYHAPPTRSKWLQAAVMEDMNNIMYRVASGYEESLGAT